MGLFGRGGARKQAGVADENVIVGRCWQNPALDAGVDAVQEGGLNAGIALLRESRTDPELRALYTEALSEAAVGHSGRIHALLTPDTAKEEAADILLWLGATLIDEAWKIRGSGTVDTVGADRFKLFFSTLARARDPLLAAAELNPDDPVPWTHLQWFAIGMQLDREEKDHIWQRVVERFPTLFPAHWGRVQMLAAKWGGSHEEMMEFARGSVQNAPPGNPLTAMIALAHAEQRLGRMHELASRKKYVAAVKLSVTYHTDEVKRELVEAARKWCAAPVDHPRDIDAHNLFGWAFKEASEDDHARWHLHQVGDRASEWPWSSGGDAAAQFAKARSSLGLA